jgi:YfiH family protein
MGDVPAIRFTALEQSAPGLVAGITVRSDPADDRSARGGEFDFGLSTGGELQTLSDRYAALAATLGFDSVTVVRQVHGSALVVVEEPTKGFHVAGEADGLITDQDGSLLVVTVADCVPVHVVSPGGTLGLFHAGWRGAAAGILVDGIAAVTRRSGGVPADLQIHLGPAICEACYEVGPDVLGEFGLDAGGKSHLDLRAVLARQALSSGVRPDSVISSPHCTRCEAGRFHSHRGLGENAGRMASFLGRIA